MSSRGYRRIIPSLTAIVEFEAVARLSSFTKASHELGLTQAAVSRQIKSLETDLGVSLFNRLYRAIELTREGEILYAAAAEAMQKIATAYDHISLGSSHQELIIESTAAFSQFYILPKLPNYQQQFPDASLRIVTQKFAADMRNDGFHLSIRYGDGQWSDGTAYCLFDEEVFPVCSPAWKAAHPDTHTLADLAAMPLIDNDPTFDGWLGWDSWFQAFGLKNQKLHYGLRCSLYTDAVNAALHGVGITLGWKRLLQPYLDAGQLVRLSEFSLKVPDKYYAVLPHGEIYSRQIESAIEWLRQEA